MERKTLKKDEGILIELTLNHIELVAEKIDSVVSRNEISSEEKHDLLYELEKLDVFLVAAFMLEKLLKESDMAGYVTKPNFWKEMVDGNDMRKFKELREWLSDILIHFVDFQEKYKEKEGEEK